MRLDGMRVAVLAADGFEQVELTRPVRRLRKEGAQVEILSLRPGRIRGMNAHTPGKKVPVDRTVYGARPEQFDALFIPGGYVSPDLLRQSERVLEFVRAFDEAGKPIAVICHAPWVLISAGLVAGRRLTGWSGISDDIRNAGAVWKDRAIVRHGNLLSSRGPQDLKAFGRAIVRHFAKKVEPPTAEVSYRSGRGRWGLLLVMAGLAGFFWMHTRPQEESGPAADDE
jgi:protease I